MSKTTFGRQSFFRLSLAAAVALAAGQALADGSMTVFESHMADGRVVLGDAPVAGAKSVKMRKYEVPSGQASRSAAAAEREYWRQQADGFERRQRAEDAARMRSSSTSRRSADHPEQLAELDGQWFAPGGYGPNTVYGAAGRPLVPLRAVPPVYTTSPGAVRGRDSGFIGSGFSTSR